MRRILGCSILALTACAGTSGGDTAGDGTTFVTVGAYELVDGDYVDRNADLTYEVGATCQIWSRTSQEHGNPPPEGHEGEHDHWNAADASTYVDGAFTWTEYGPFLTEAEVDAACGAGTDPSDPKTVTAEEYTEFQPGLFLRIKDVVVLSLIHI